MMNRKYFLMLLLFISYSIHIVAQTDFYYYKGQKIPLTRNENKVVVSIPKDHEEAIERIRSYVRVLDNIRDNDFDIFVLSQSELERLKAQEFWKEDAKSVI
jgi:hypothetical protein